MKDLGSLRWILGMEIKRDRHKRVIQVNQTAYINQMLQRYGMMDSKPVGTPAEGVLKRVPKNSENKADSEYMAVVGSLLYVAMITPDQT